MRCSCFCKSVCYGGKVPTVFIVGSGVDGRSAGGDAGAGLSGYSGYVVDRIDQIGGRLFPVFQCGQHNLRFLRSTKKGTGLTTFDLFVECVQGAEQLAVVAWLMSVYDALINTVLYTDITF